MKKLSLLILMFVFAGIAKAEDGHKLWLRYEQNGNAVVKGPRCKAAEELVYYSKNNVELLLDSKMEDDEYRIEGDKIYAKGEIGLLYGAYAYLRGERTGNRMGGA